MKQVIIDTNIFARLLVHDIDDQFIKSQRVFQEIEDGKSRGLVSILVVNELVWILEKFYKIPRDKYLPDLVSLLALKGIKIMEISKPQLIQVLKKMGNNKIDFADVYLSIVKKEGWKIESFDRDFNKL